MQYGPVSYDLTNNAPLPSQYVIMKIKHKFQLSKIPSICNIGEGVTVESRSDGVAISYRLIMAAESDARVIHLLSYETDVFVLLVYWV